MNWLKKIAYQATPQIASPVDDLIDLVDQIVLNRPGKDGKVIDLTGAEMRLQQAQAQGVAMDAVCQRINELAAGVNPVRPDASARPKMDNLAEAAGCKKRGLWNPVNPPMAQQPDNNMMNDPSMMPQMGQQEQPTEMPSTEFEN